MSKARIVNDVPAEMTQGHEVETVSNGDVTITASEGLADGLDNLRSAYQEFWSETHPSTEPGPEHPAERVEPGAEQPDPSTEVHSSRAAQRKVAVFKSHQVAKKKTGKKTGEKTRKPERLVRQRFGLPKDFVPRMQRFGRGVLLEMNSYRLPNGQEFLPSLPTGTLGSRHLYALLTNEQYLQGTQGSVYVRGDGRIFDYSVISDIPLGDMFDTGYTIYDLERTGRYAPAPVVSRQVAGAVGRSLRKQKKKTKQKRHRRTAAAGRTGS
jgi:hypothetical protein